MNCKTILNVVGTAVAITAYCVGCSGDDGNGGGNPGGNDPVTNPGGGGGSGCAISGYKTKTIGSQTWMAENLNCNVSGSVCYDNNSANCTKYGRLYNWEAAKNACPAGWHLPSDDEWTQLTDFVGDSSTAGTKLKSSTGWESYSGVPKGTDTYGFSALPGGYGYSGGLFLNAGNLGYWWSATESDADYAWSRSMYYSSERVYRYNGYKSYLFSVRCVQD